MWSHPLKLILHITQPSHKFRKLTWCCTSLYGTSVWNKKILQHNKHLWHMLKWPISLRMLQRKKQKLYSDIWYITPTNNFFETSYYYVFHNWLRTPLKMYFQDWDLFINFFFMLMLSLSLVVHCVTFRLNILMKINGNFWVELL